MATIIFKINGIQHEVDGRFGPDVSLNEYIRNVADLRGTKTMCQEGGCGACIVAVKAALPPTHEVKIFSVNSCLVSVLSCHGWEITTVEGLGNRNEGYHEIQSRLASFNGTQCGYCTPGWVMNMYSLYLAKNKKLSAAEVENSFASNICRCTGYRPIADAFKSFATDAEGRLKKKIIDIEDMATFTCGFKCSKDCIHKSDCTKNTNDDEWCLIEKATIKTLTIKNDKHKWFKVNTLTEVFKAISDHHDYKLIAGNTGQGVYHISEYPKNIIDIFNVTEIKGYSLDVNLILGSGMVLTDMMEVFLKLSSENKDFEYLKEFYQHMDLVAHIPVRNIGTIGGNLYMKYANNEFPSDIFLLFETVGAMITIAGSVNKKKTVTLTEFLKMNMKDSIILNVLLPPLSSSCRVKTYKIMPRSQNAHAIVNAGFLIKFKKNDLIDKVNIVYGNITPQFIHAENTEKVLIDKDPFTEDTLQLALKNLYEEIRPDSRPPEPSPEYRKLLAVTLFYKAILSLCPEGKLNETYRSGGDVIKRHSSTGTQTYDTDESVWPLNKPVAKLEALVQCSGEATFANDLPTQTNEVYAAFVTADIKPGSVITGFDTTNAFKIPGVLAFYSASDIPGENNFTPTNISFISTKEEIICSKEIQYHGQAVGIIVADRERTANNAAKFVDIKYKPSDAQPLLSISDVLASNKDQRINKIKDIEATDTGSDVKNIIHGEIILESQYHYYMEPQTCVVRPTEDGFEVYSSTQYLDLTNVAVAQCLNVPINSINVIVRRVGGGYGGKITRSSQVACGAALVSHLQGKLCRFVLPLETNMKTVGKRIPTYCKFEVGVNENGEIQYLKIKYYQDNGCSINETIALMTLNHLPNCYDPKRWSIEAYTVITDTPSTTWCRAPASTEGIAIIEYIMEKIAYTLKKDPLEVRFLNIKQGDNPIPELIEQLKKDSNFDDRLEEIKQFNEKNRWRKRSLKIMPMTYEMFYIGPFNATVSIYHGDGSVVITHGATEMGQGINTKTAQVCAYMFGIPLERVSVKPSTSFTSPNCMGTGASVGSELVAYATTKACEILLDRLKPIREKLGNPSWEDLIEGAHESGVYLQASHMYSTFEPVKPYDIYGIIAMEIELDILTGNHDIRRVDLLEDTGRSLNPEIDIGQIEGAFVMGLGYWTSEKLVYDRETGRLLTDRTWTYKPPGIKDIPADFRIYFRRNSVNNFGVLQSKATGEPSLCLASVITHAFREAVSQGRRDAGYEDQWIHIEYPCTSENIFMAMDHKLEHFKLK
ncbi:uncharacterized protein LOC116770815 [Danaus plexippus]|uniref:uncharacterized protein LOC116770815 n=1 Tax=Danaus plexippus TaxID=13037 RepID=UPI002AB09833|nr:uncharacterized protein LOC116770815 [Danaus plexippus]